MHTQNFKKDSVGVEVPASSFMEVFSASEQRSLILLNHLASISADSAVSIYLNRERLCLCHPWEDHYSVVDWFKFLFIYQDKIVTQINAFRIRGDSFSYFNHTHLNIVSSFISITAFIN